MDHIYFLYFDKTGETGMPAESGDELYMSDMLPVGKYM
jgi:hypothetical protein